MQCEGDSGEGEDLTHIHIWVFILYGNNDIQYRGIYVKNMYVDVLVSI